MGVVFATNAIGLKNAKEVSGVGTTTFKADSGPLHTRTKSCDHGIVRAQKKVSKCHPKTPPESRSVVTDPQV
jgi:hypothetical protein